MDFSDLMSIASTNKQSTVIKGKNKKSKDGSSGQVSSEAVKAFLARQNAEKVKQKEQVEAARRARIQARLQEKQLDISKNKPDDDSTSNDTVSQKPKKSVKNQSATRSQDSNKHLKQNTPERKRAHDERKIGKSKEKDKIKKTPEERPPRIEEKKPVAKVKKSARPTMSFQELMNVAKQQRDDPDAFRSSMAALEQKNAKIIEEKSSPKDPSMTNGRTNDVKAPGRNSPAGGKINREKNKISQNAETRDRKLPETGDRRQPEIQDRKQPKSSNGKHSEIRDRKIPGNRDRKIPGNCDRKIPENRDRKVPENRDRKVQEIRGRETLGERDRKFPGKQELDVKRKFSEKPRTMTIERQTISQKDDGARMKHGGSSFERKRRHNPYDDDDDYDEDMDEFIDDSGEAPETISGYIKDIFGYDRNKFRDRDEDVGNMESSFADIQREEAKSLRIAKLEDEVEKLKESYELQEEQKKKKRKL